MAYQQLSCILPLLKIQAAKSNHLEFFLAAQLFSITKFDGY
jgi:hypothetical protein